MWAFWVCVQVTTNILIHARSFYWELHTPNSHRMYIYMSIHRYSPQMYTHICSQLLSKNTVTAPNVLCQWKSRHTWHPHPCCLEAETHKADNSYWQTCPAPNPSILNARTRKHTQYHMFPHLSALVQTDVFRALRMLRVSFVFRSKSKALVIFQMYVVTAHGHF